MSEISWRAAELADADDLGGLFRAIELVASIGLETVPAEVRGRLSMPRLDLRVDTMVGVDAALGMVAYAEAADMGVGAGRFRIRLTCALHPEVAGEVLSTVLDWLTRRAGQMRSDRHPDLAGVAGHRCAAADHARRTVLTAAGFEVDHWHHEMTRNVAEPVPGQVAIAGVAIVPYDARYCEAARLAQNDAFADEPHGRLLDTRDWPNYAVGLATFLPDASFLALADTAGPAAGHGEEVEVAAYVLSLKHGGQTGNQVATLESLGTRRNWYRRGLATSVIGHALAAYRQAGFSTARLQVCSHNTSAVSLYTKLGFTNSDRGYASMMGPVP